MCETYLSIVSVSHSIFATTINTTQNHFQMVGTHVAGILERSRDLTPEISREEATQKTASVITKFMEIH